MVRKKRQNERSCVEFVNAEDRQWETQGKGKCQNLPKAPHKPVQSLDGGTEQQPRADQS